MKRVGQFEKVSYKEFKNSMLNLFDFKTDLKSIYEYIILPQRATKYSAGYDFFSPIDICIEPAQSVKIPTAIKVKIEAGWFLALYPRSSLGFKYRLQFDNTVGIIDGDYYYSDNEGHIFVKLTNGSNDKIFIEKGSKFIQGIFCEYGITYNDDVKQLRNGGIGSTDFRDNYTY